MDHDLPLLEPHDSHPRTIESQAFITLPTVNTAAMNQLRVCFCIDTSYSTSYAFCRGAEGDRDTTVLQIEKLFVNNMAQYLAHRPSFISWNTQAESVADTDELVSKDGTNPCSIFMNPFTRQIVREAECMVLVTDGYIDPNVIGPFSRSIRKYGSHLQMVLGVIVMRRIPSNLCPGSRYHPFFSRQALSSLLTPSSLLTRKHCQSLIKPAEVDISVLLPAMIADSCIIMHNWHNNYVLWADGSYGSQLRPTDIDTSTTWDQVTTAQMSELASILTTCSNPQSVTRLVAQNYVPMGECTFFNADHLLASSPTRDQFTELPFDKICRFFKANQRCRKLLTWLQQQRQRYSREFVGSLSGATTNPDLQAYIDIRDTVLAHQELPDDTLEPANTGDPTFQALIAHIDLIISAVSQDSRQQHTQAGYTTASINRSRYCDTGAGLCYSEAGYNISFATPTRWLRHYLAADTTGTLGLCTSLSDVHNPRLSLQGTTPLTTECSICMELDIPFVLVRKPFSRDDTEQLTNRPFDYIYNELVCSKCATYFCNTGRDPVRVSCIAALPLAPLSTIQRLDYLLLLIAIADFEIDEIYSEQFTCFTHALHSCLTVLFDPKTVQQLCLVFPQDRA